MTADNAEPRAERAEIGAAGPEVLPAQAGRGQGASDRALGVLALLLVGAGAVLRLVAARRAGLDGDEALHWALAHQPSAALVYHWSLTNAHPPLYFLFLHAWHQLGTSELWLRLPSVAFGTLASWCAWRFASRLVDRRAALVATAIVALSPGLIDLTAQVRGYGLLLFLSLLALIALEEALIARTSRRLLLFAIPLLLSILTHYAAVWIVLPMAIYSAARLRGASRGVRAGWLLLWTGVAGVYAILFLSHVRALHGSSLEQEAIQGWLAPSYFESGRDHLATWLPVQTKELAAWLSGLQPPWGARVGWILAAAFLLGVVRLAVKRQLAVILLAAPFLLAGTAAWLHLYPFGGTRHSSYLAPLLAAGAGALVSGLGGKRAWPAVLVALLAGILPWLWSRDPVWRSMRECQAAHWIEEALEHVRTSVPADAVLCVDQQSRVLIEYYAMREPYPDLAPAPTGFFERRLDGRLMLSELRWHHDAQSFRASLVRMASAYGIPRGKTVWTVNIGLEKNLAFDLAARAGYETLIAPKTFGFCVSVFGVRMP